MDDLVLLPNDRQCEALGRMMSLAFVEIRALGWMGRAEQATDLADAFHNLPTEMYGVGRWDVRVFRSMLLHYQAKHYPAGAGPHDYVAMLDRVFPNG